MDSSETRVLCRFHETLARQSKIVNQGNLLLIFLISLCLGILPRTADNNKDNATQDSRKRSKLLRQILEE
jgi:hypothetical protein